MIITKTVKIEIKNANIKYYKNKGYICKVGNIIDVDVVDVCHTSQIPIKIACDKCGKEKDITIEKLHKRLKYKNGNFICHECIEEPQCIICGSKNKVSSWKDGKKYCSKHFGQLRYNGKILNRTIYDKNEIIIKSNYAEIVLYNKQSEEIARALIDIEDVEKCKTKKWNMVKKTGNYAKCMGKRTDTPIYLHHFIMDTNTNLNIVIDHINGNGLDNRKSNLRIVTSKENAWNISVSNVNTSGITGVSFNKNRKTWYVSIIKNNKKYYLGCYKDKKEAILIRYISEYILFAEYSRSYKILDRLLHNVKDDIKVIFDEDSNTIHKKLYKLIKDKYYYLIDGLDEFINYERRQLDV